MTLIEDPGGAGTVYNAIVNGVFQGGYGGTIVANASNGFDITLSSHPAFANNIWEVQVYAEDNLGGFAYDAWQFGVGQRPLPVSETWDIYDACEPTDAEVLFIDQYIEFTQSRALFAAPYYTFNGSNDLVLYSNDDANTGFTIETAITASFTLQFTILPSALPADFSSLATERFFIAAHNQYGKMIGLLLSEDEGVALATTGTDASYQVLTDTAELFDSGLQYYTFRIALDGGSGNLSIYITPTALLSVIGHQLVVTTTALDTPVGTPDGLAVETYGSAANPTTIAIDCIRLSTELVIPNSRPVADPGVDQTSTLYKYAAFDGRNSYDPEGRPLRYWWTITSAPETSEMWISGTGQTPADASGFTNRVISVANAFNNAKVGDLLFIEDEKSPIKYIHSDGSYVLTIDKVFAASTSNLAWNVLIQSAWEGDWIPSSTTIVLDYTNTEPGAPTIDDLYLVGDTPVGPNWVAGDAGKFAQWNGLSWDISVPTLGQIVYSIADYLNYRLVDTGPYVWTADSPELWELAYWTGRTSEIGTMLPDVNGLYSVELVVNDGTAMVLPPISSSIEGSLNSLPAEALLNVSATGAPLGLVPDLSFIWNYLSNFWTLVDNKEMMQTVWSGAAQILAGDMLELWQNDYAKGLFDIQRLYQRRWRGYDFFYEEPSYDDELYEAAIDTTVDYSGYSATPGLTDYAYDLGITAPSTVENGHLLILNGQAYEIARTKGQLVITRDVLPQTRDARIYIDTITAPFAVGDVVTGGTSTNTATVTAVEWNYLEVAIPTGAFTPTEALTGVPSGGAATVSAYEAPNINRPRFWQIRPQITSKSTDFTLEAAQQADTVIFDIEDADENDHVRVGCYVYAALGYKLCFDDTNLTTYKADPDRYTIRFFGLVRRNYIPIDEKIRDISSLQEVIDIDNVEDAPAILVGNNDFIVETLTAIDGREVQVINLLESYLERKDSGFDGDTSTTPDGQYFDSAGSDFTTTLGVVGTDLSNFLLSVNGERYRLLEVTSATRVKLADLALTTGETNLHWRIYEAGDPPDRSWSETTFVDNKDAIEANFGVRVDFRQDDWEQRTEDLDYLAAVRGLWYAFWNGPTINNIRTACQVLMGLPFAEKAGTVIDVRTPFNTKYNRVLVQDDSDEVIIRSYLFPVDLNVDTNPTTSLPYTYGDSIAQFAPICDGVEIKDYITDPTWMSDLVGSSEMHEIQKYHTFGVVLDSAAFNFTNLQHMISYLVRLTDEATPKIRPHYTRPIFIVTYDISDEIEVTDALLLGPAWPPEIPSSPGTYYKYPFNTSWLSGLNDIYPGWVDSPFYPDPTRWESIVTYDHTERWPTTRVSNVPPVTIDFGGLHLSDVSGNVPDPWTGSWPQNPIGGGTHSATRAEGTFQYGDTDESGHYIHVYGNSASNLLTDSDMSAGGFAAWSFVNYSGSSLPFSASKSGPPGYQYTSINTAAPQRGIEQGASVTAGFQLCASAHIFMISGQAHVTLRDQSKNILSEWRIIAPVGAWRKIVLHYWDSPDSTAYVSVITGPAGGNFYVDDVFLYSVDVPWTQWGYGRMYMGRTGGYTVGGLPDEDMELTLHATWP